MTNVLFCINSRMKSMMLENVLAKNIDDLHVVRTDKDHLLQEYKRQTQFGMQPDMVFIENINNEYSYIKEVKNFNPNAFIVLIVNASFQDMLRAAKNGVVYFLYSPFSKHNVEWIIDKFKEF